MTLQNDIDKADEAYNEGMFVSAAGRYRAILIDLLPISPEQEVTYLARHGTALG